MKAVVTGGAGFIGSHLADSLISEGNEVFVVDNLVSGLRENVNEKAVFMKRDIRHDLSNELEGMDAVFHLAADPDVRASAEDPQKSLDINLMGTISVLESCRKADVRRVIFTSTSTVYGETDVIPTPETHPCCPISNYGASKLACEAYISAYCSTYGMKGTSLRLANIFGERSTHGVMYDFYHKLMHDGKRLEILGDGNQDKSYLHVSDCVSAVLAVSEKQAAQYDVFNIGSDEKIKVSALAKMESDALGLRPEFHCTGTARGWAGDVRLMLLDCKKMKALGWSPKLGFEGGMKRYLAWLSRA
jgi:UDP-glucose 4-epimerase